MASNQKQKKPAKVRPAGLPTRQQVMDFIAEADTPAGKREIAKAFGLKGQEKIALKALLKDMADEGLIDIGPARAFHKMGGVPKVTVLRIVDVDDTTLIATPEKWDAEGRPAPRLRIVERGKRGALTIGDRILARTEEAGRGWIAHPMKKLAKASEELLGVVEEMADGKLWLRPVDKRIRKDTPISDAGEARPGDLVLAEPHGRPPRISARVTEILGDPFAPRSFSLIAIHKHGIPHVFPDRVEDDALTVAALPLHEDKREDLRHLPIVAIDPVDARDHDDAVWAAPDEDEGNPGGYKAIVAIADVSYYVRPGSALDKEARKRGNSVYFPDLVVPMLPHQLSSDMCSLRAGEDRAAMACHLTINAQGKVTAWRFTRAVIRVAAVLAYEDAQAAIDGTKDRALLEPALKPLWACWELLQKARKARDPLALDLPEDYFNSVLRKPIAQLRLLYYPPVEKKRPEPQMGIGAHTDYECFTILWQTEPGLQVQNRNNEWIDAPPVEGTFVVNVGDMMMRWTNNLFRSTPHRVVTRARNKRYSFPFFFAANYDTVVRCLETCISEKTPPTYPPTKFGYWVENMHAYSYVYRHDERGKLPNPELEL